MNNSKSNIVRVVLPYALFGALYIILSDFIVRDISTEVDDLFIISLVKGLLYVMVTAVLVYFLVKNYTRKMISVNKNFNRVFQSLPEAVILFNKETKKITACNEAAQKITGYNLDELTGISPETLFLSQYSTSNVSSLISNPGIKSNVLCKLVTKSGDLLSVNLSNAIIKNPISDTQCVLIVRDLSELDAQHKEIQRQKIQLEEIMSGVDSIIWSYVEEAKGFLYINQAAERIFEKPIQQITSDTDVVFN